MEYIILLFVIALITGLIGQYVAKEKKREQAEGFILGFLLSVLGILIVALLPTQSSNQQPQVIQELTEEEKVALAEKQRQFEEARKRGQKIVKRNNNILFGIVVVCMLFAAIMMWMKNRKDAQELEKYKAEQQMLP